MAIERLADGTCRTKKRTREAEECTHRQAAKECALDALEPGASIIQLKAACADCLSAVTTSQSNIAPRQDRRGRDCIVRRDITCDFALGCSTCPRKKEAF